MAEDKKVEESKESEKVETEDGSEEGKKKKSSLIVVILIVILVLAISTAGFLVLKSGDSAEDEAKKLQAQPLPSVFFEMPEIIVSLSGNSSNIRYLKLVLSLEIATAEDQAVVEAQLPKITDEYQTYLRQLRLEDLRGSVGTYRLKEALLLRINQVVQPVEVKDVLLKEMLVQ